MGLTIAFTQFSACAPAEKKTPVIAIKAITRDFPTDLNLLLPNGDFTADIVDKIKMSPRRQLLQDKFMNAMKADPDWFLAQQKQVQLTGKEPAYDARLGMTEAEWEEYKTLMSSPGDMEAEPSGSETINIRNVGGSIHFKAGGRLADFNEISIDLNKKEVYMMGRTLPLIDTICVKNEQNVFKTAWRGYEFQFTDDPNRGMPKNKEELQSLNMVLYTFTLGLFPKTGRTYIEIAGSEVANGRELKRFKLPVILR